MTVHSCCSDTVFTPFETVLKAFSHHFNRCEPLLFCSEKDGNQSVVMHYVDTMKAIQHLLKDVRLAGHLYKWFELHRNSRGRRTFDTFNAGVLMETKCAQLVSEGRGDCMPVSCFCSADGSLGGKSKMTDMVYMSAGCVPDWYRRLPAGWVLVAVIPHLNDKELKKHRGRTGYDSVGARKSELAQQCWWPLVKPWVDAEEQRLTAEWDVAGQRIKVAPGFGVILGDLAQHWMFLGEAHFTCIWCHSQRCNLHRFGRYPLKLGSDQTRRIIDASRGYYPTWNTWRKGQRRGAPVIMFAPNKNGIREPTNAYTAAEYERSRKATGLHVQQRAYDAINAAGSDANQQVLDCFT